MQLDGESHWPPGWHEQVEQPGFERYWDGNAWTERVRPKPLSGAEIATAQAEGNSRAPVRLSGHIVVLWTFLTAIAFLFGGNALCQGAHEGVQDPAAPGGPCDSFGDIASYGLPIAIPMMIVGLCLFTWWLVGKQRSSRACPRCGRQVAVGRLDCPHCQFDFRTI